MITSLITAIAFYLKTSTIEPFAKCRQGCTIYATLCGYPSTGKSPAMRIVQEAVKQLEKFHKITNELSRLTNAATTEALIALLEQLSCLIGKTLIIDLI